MLKNLTYTVEFASPSRTLSANIDFQEGMTAITGPNGKGKSMILEMVQYALHGTEALRGKAEDYKKMEVSLTFLLNGKLYRVERTKVKALLLAIDGEQNEPLASGTKPVNQKIIELFGYSAEVFRMANVCNQGKIEELGNMKPTARKQLVDETIGLNVLDQLVVLIDEERKRLSGGIKAVDSILKPPVEPVKPEGLEESSVYAAQKSELSQQKLQREVVQSVACRTLQEPEKVELHYCDSRLGEMLTAEDRRKEIKTELGVLAKQFVDLPVPPDSLVDSLEPDDHNMDEYQRLLQHRRDQLTKREMLCKQIGQVLTSEWTADELDKQEALLFAYQDWGTKRALKSKNIPHDCPSCGHHWEDEDPRLENYAAVPDAEPERPRLTQNQISIHRRTLERISEQQPLIHEFEVLDEQLLQSMSSAEQAEEAVTRIQKTRMDYQKSQVAREKAEHREKLLSKMQDLEKELEKTVSYEDVILEIQDRRTRLDKYKIEYQHYLNQKAEVDSAKEKLKSFDPELDQKMSEAESKYADALTYEANLKHYLDTKLVYEKAMVELQVLKDELEDWTKSREAVAELRVRVKGYLLPSLNSVSSHLVNQMTGGELSWLVVNDQFDITVESQRLETLSGAGEAVANLALRIGLGQVLTNRVFSVMMLDEIDASCDEDRAKYIAGCLRNLTKTVKQVIQVSHKQGLEADHYVRL